MTGPHVTVVPDPPQPHAALTAISHEIVVEHERWRTRVSALRDLLPPGPKWGTTQSIAGLCAPIGFAEGLPVELTLADAAPHALIGGPSGSGKTNLLLTMIASMAARYSPDELELYLLDFKEGVSFAQFAPGRRDPTWLPHARLIGVNINTDREFGLALLQHLADEMRHRAEVAKENEVTKLEELREVDPEGRWPRIVAVIDEFQVLFAERDAVTREAARLLEDVVRRGRSQGIHLVLASQDVSSIEAFWGRPGDLRAVRAAHRAAAGPPGARRGQRRDAAPAALARRGQPRVGHRARQRDRPHPGRHRQGIRGRGPAPAVRAGGGRRRRAAAAVRRQPRARRSTSCSRRSTSEADAPPVAVVGQCINVAGSTPRCRCPRRPGATSGSSGPGSDDAVGRARHRRRGAGACSTTAARPGSCSHRSWPRRVPAAMAVERRLTGFGHGVDDGAARRLPRGSSRSSPPRCDACCRARTGHRSTWCSTRATPPTPSWTKTGTDALRTVLRFGPGDRRAHDRLVAQPAAAQVAAVADRVAGRPRLRASGSTSRARSSARSSRGCRPRGRRGPAAR